MKELLSFGKEATVASTAGKAEAGAGALKWLNHAKDAVAVKVIWLGKELKALTLTSAYVTGAAGIAAGIGLGIAGRSYMRWRKERLKRKYGGGKGGH